MQKLPSFYEGSIRAALGNDASNLAITDADLAALTQDTQWHNTQLPSVYNALEQVMWGSASIAGLQRIQLPAEYIAACIVVAVHEVNWYTACIRMADHAPTTLEAEAGYSDERDPVTARQLFSMVQLAAIQYETVARNIENRIRAVTPEELQEIAS